MKMRETPKNKLQILKNLKASLHNKLYYFAGNFRAGLLGVQLGTGAKVSPKANINDMLLSESVYSESNFAYTYNNYRERVVVADKNLNDNVVKAADELGLSNNLHKGMLTTMDVFGPYIDFERVLSRIPKEYEVLGEEMEAFGLIHVANSMGRHATAIATVVDSKFSDVVLSIEERQTSLNNMIKLALEAIIK